MNSSFCFTSEHAFFIANAAILVISGLTLRAFAGQMETQRMQPMHFVLSVTRGLAGSIALAGQRFAHKPQAVQEALALGTIADPAFLYGLFPGTEILPDAAFAFSSI